MVFQNLPFSKESDMWNDKLHGVSKDRWFVQEVECLKANIPFIRAACEAIQEAKTWKEARERLLYLHNYLCQNADVWAASMAKSLSDYCLHARPV